MTAAAKEVRRTLGTFLEITRKQLLAPRVQRIRAWEAMLPARNPDLAVLDVFELEEPCFATA